MDKWVLSTIQIQQLSSIIMDVLYWNSMINHHIRKNDSERRLYLITIGSR